MQRLPIWDFNPSNGLSKCISPRCHPGVYSVGVGNTSACCRCSEPPPGSLTLSWAVQRVVVTVTMAAQAALLSPLHMCCLIVTLGGGHRRGRNSPWHCAPSRTLSRPSALLRGRVLPALSPPIFVLFAYLVLSSGVILAKKPGGGSVHLSGKLNSCSLCCALRGLKSSKSRNVSHMSCHPRGERWISVALPASRLPPPAVAGEGVHSLQPDIPLQGASWVPHESSKWCAGKPALPST